MKRLLRLLAFILIPVGVMAQNDGIPADTVNVAEQEEAELGEIFIDVEEMPEYPGGYDAMYKYIAENISYPPIAVEKNIQGKVYVQIVIDKVGQVQESVVVRSVDPILDNEAIRIIRNMPNWTPGKQRGKPVNVRMILPITFALN